ncbi:MAG: non-homologous end-joining DNA ligase [Acidimicrobiales bacterium]
MSPENKVVVEVDGRCLTLSNLDKALYPNGFTKRDLLDYYARIAPIMLPHLHGRVVTRKRFPDGTGRDGFIEKNVPRHAPHWVRTVTLPRKGTGWGASKTADPGRDTTEYVLVPDLATLTWLVNLATIEVHTPMWRIGRDSKPKSPDLIVFDLDPGTPATIVECCKVALRLRERLGQDGIELLSKTSGSKGLQCYGAIGPRRWAPGRSNEYAHGVAAELEDSDPGLIVSKMKKELRPGKVLIDWSQNNVAKTTASPYSLRALERPSVSTPLGWDEVETGATGDAELLRFEPQQVLERVERVGDLFARLLA